MTVMIGASAFFIGNAYGGSVVVLDGAFGDVGLLHPLVEILVIQRMRVMLRLEGLAALVHLVFLILIPLRFSSLDGIVP